MQSTRPKHQTIELGCWLDQIQLEARLDGPRCEMQSGFTGGILQFPPYAGLWVTEVFGNEGSFCQGAKVLRISSALLDRPELIYEATPASFPSTHGRPKAPREKRVCLC